MAKAIMGAWLDITPEVEAEFADWYFREHVPERVTLPGFLSGRRYSSPEAGPNRYLALYQAKSVEVFASPAYRERLNNPTAWTDRIMPNFRNFTRSVFHVRRTWGEPYGGTIATLRYASGGDCRDWLEGEALPALAERSGICRVRLLEADEAQSAPDTSEARMRGDEGGNAWAPWAIIADGIGPDWLGPALDAAGLEAGLAERGALDIATGRYDLVFGMENRD